MGVLAPVLRPGREPVLDRGRGEAEVRKLLILVAGGFVVAWTIGCSGGNHSQDIDRSRESQDEQEARQDRQPHTVGSMMDNGTPGQQIR